MAEFQIHTIETAPAASKPLLEAAQKNFGGMLPNLFGVFAEAPKLLEGYATLSGIFAKSSLSDVEQHIVYLTVSYENGCTYCMAAHTVGAQMSGVDAGIVESLRDGTAIADDKLEALRQFTGKMVADRGWVSTENVQAFLDAGYTREQVLDVVLGVGLKTLSNYTNHLASTPVDEPFKAHVWSKPSTQAAE